MQGTDEECEDLATVWASRERFPEDYLCALHERDVLAEGGQLPRRPAPNPSMVYGPRQVTEAALVPLRALSSYSFTEVVLTVLVVYRLFTRER